VAITVRRATLADLPAVLEMRLALLREHGDNRVYRRLRADAEERAERLYSAQLQATNEVIFLAERGREVVGILRCVLSAGSPLLSPAQYGYVSSAYVRPTARRAGVLRLLLDAAETWCGERGLTEIRLHNAADNPTANAAWDAMGFEIVEYMRVREIRLESGGGGE
jgi:ribosomal protein S18 acetylase RimI-like enzyme